MLEEGSNNSPSPQFKPISIPKRITQMTNSDSEDSVVNFGDILKKDMNKVILGVNTSRTVDSGANKKGKKHKRRNE